ncbi:heterokaryon incompatibility, partial [Polyplosphaeria fusca]
SLPKTIEDAIIVCKRVGARYIWIDSLCIDQSNVADKLNQVKLMDRIYQGAAATIVVLDSVNAHSGI